MSAAQNGGAAHPPLARVNKGPKGRSNSDLDDATMRAVVSIQQHFRGWKTRKNLMIRSLNYYMEAPPPTRADKHSDDGLAPKDAALLLAAQEGDHEKIQRLCKENIFRMRGEVCDAETDDARWLFHAVHSVVTISESEGRPWGEDEPRVNLLVVTGHDLPVSELYACLRMSLIEEAEKSADAMAQALLKEVEDEELKGEVTATERAKKLARAEAARRMLRDKGPSSNISLRC